MVSSWNRFGVRYKGKCRCILLLLCMDSVCFVEFFTFLSFVLFCWHCIFLVMDSAFVVALINVFFLMDLLHGLCNLFTCILLAWIPFSVFGCHASFCFFVFLFTCMHGFLFVCLFAWIRCIVLYSLFLLVCMVFLNLFYTVCSHGFVLCFGFVCMFFFFCIAWIPLSVICSHGFACVDFVFFVPWILVLRGLV